MCYCELDNAPTVYWESHPVARKKHNCCECRSEIGPGEKYYCISGVWEGEFNTFKQCQVCKNVWEEAVAEGVECICFGDLWEIVGSEYEYAGVL